MAACRQAVMAVWKGSERSVSISKGREARVGAHGDGRWGHGLCRDVNWKHEVSVHKQGLRIGRVAPGVMSSGSSSLSTACGMGVKREVSVDKQGPAIGEEAGGVDDLPPRAATQLRRYGREASGECVYAFGVAQERAFS